MKKQNSMDFGDMINNATELLEKDPLHQSNKYDYILIDEYQDMNLQRYKLTKLLFKRNPEAKLFAVGDDWQSIMAFSGSNLRYFTNFDTYFPNPTISHISTNYRSCTTIVQCGAHLINNNGTSQIPKNPSAQNRQNAEIKIIHISPSKNSDHGNEIKIKEWYYNKMASVCTNLIKTKLSSGYKPQDILLLTRYNKIDVLFDKLTDYCKRNAINVARGKKHIMRNEQFKDSVRIMTVHQSKGLQAPCVIILDVVCGDFGFPSLIEDPEIMEPAIDNTFDRVEEERRLFYVALTRAQKELFIFTRTDYESQFINEIEPYVKHEYKYY
jgi:DNA helicase-4